MLYYFKFLLIFHIRYTFFSMFLMLFFRLRLKFLESLSASQQLVISLRLNQHLDEDSKVDIYYDEDLFHFFDPVLRAT